MRATILRVLVGSLVGWLFAGYGDPLRAQYAEEVLLDFPIAYWRLGEDFGALTAFNETGDASLDGTFVGEIGFEEEGLLFDDSNPAVLFNGFDSEIQFVDSPLVNTGGPHAARSIELWFRAELVDIVPGVLFEEGGVTRGINLYVQEIDGVDTVTVLAWNRAEAFWGPIVLSTPIAEGQVYHLVLVFDASANEEFADFDGRVTAYLNGAAFGDETGADLLYAHGDDFAIGGIFTNVLFPDLSNPGDGANFTGTIDEVALYDYPLDDPDDDGDREDSRVLDHYLAGADENCPGGVQASAEGRDIVLTWTASGSEMGVRVTRNGEVLAESAPVSPPRFVDANVRPGDHIYELDFDTGARDCPSQAVGFGACLTALAASARGSDVALTWSGAMDVGEIEVRRDGEVIATLAGDVREHVDPSPSVGPHRYEVDPGGECEPISTTFVVLESGYPTQVLSDGAFGYWRLEEEDGIDAANAGSIGALLNGVYQGDPELGSDGLLDALPDSSALRFDGFDDVVFLPDHPLLNTAGPYNARSIELWFSAEIIDLQPRVVLEEGGATRGLSIYVQEIDGVDTLFAGAWNLAETSWGPLFVQVEVEEGEIYHVVFVFDASEDEVFANLDGRVTLYLDGDEIETVVGADQLFAHTDDCAIGGIIAQSLLADGVNPGAGNHFQGIIDDVSIYGSPLDDPDDDGDRSDSVVFDHFLAGSRGGGGPRPRFRRGDTDTDGRVTLTDAVSTLNFLFAQGPDTTCKETQDADNDGAVLLTDAVSTLIYLFGGGTPPAAPGPIECGTDPDAAGSEDDLGCASYRSC